MNLQDIEKYFKGRPCYIIGKGPSLDDLNEGDFDIEVPILCINDSIHKMESLNIQNPLFVMQQDMSLKDACKPQRGTLIVASAAHNHYPDLCNKVVFHMEELQLRSCLTVIAAIRMLQRFGATELRMRAFDACINKNTNYASSIGYTSTRGGKPSRFLEHRAKIMAEVKVPIDWR